jgi:transketolase
MTIRSLRKELGDYLSRKALDDERIVALEGDLCESTQSVIFKHTIPQRHFEMGIAEQNMVGVAAGMAASGKIPFVHSFACFLSMRACEQIRTAVCYPKLNVKFIATHGGLFAGSAGSTHHATEDVAIMRSLPNMTVLVPGDSVELRKVIDAAIEHHGPVYIRIAKDDVADVFADDRRFDIGRSLTPVAGNDATIITTGTMLSSGIEASEMLRKEHNLSVRVLHCASLKPIDCEAVLKAARETTHIVTLEEHSIIGGLGSAVCEIIAQAGIGRVTRIGINDHFCGIGTQSHLFIKEGLTVGNIVNEMLKLKSTNSAFPGETHENH